MNFLTPIFYIVFFVWLMAGLCYFGDAAEWFFDSHSWWVSFVAWPLAFILSTLPFGIFVVMGILFYYLAFVLDWNIIVAILFVCPGLIGIFLGPFAYLIDKITSSRRF